MIDQDYSQPKDLPPESHYKECRFQPLLHRVHFQTHKLCQSHIQTMAHTQMWGSIKAAWMHVCQMSARCDPRKTNEKMNMDNNINMYS